MGITSVNLSIMPFVSSCDSTRSGMQCRQLSQSLTHKNCDVPYVMCNEWRNMRDGSSMGIYKAPEDGEIVFNDADLLIVLYKNDKMEVKRIPPIKKATSVYSSTLRHNLPAGTKFKMGDILYEYDCFNQGYPSFGYNTMTMFTPFFGYNHEDSLTVSESFMERTKYNLMDKVYVPIYEYTLLQKLYQNSIGYFPEIGDKIHGDCVCSSLLPAECKATKDLDPTSIRNKVLKMLKGMNLSDLINMRVSGSTTGFAQEQIKSKVEGYVTGMKIHRIKKDVELIDKDLQKVVDKLHIKYGQFILNTYNSLTSNFSEEYAKRLMKQYFVYSDRDKQRGSINLTDAVFLLEYEISKEYTSVLGDKYSNMHAAKGVVSLVLPDELRPVTARTKTPVDYIYNPFGIFSRQNLSQLLEGVCSKIVWSCDRLIRENPNNVAKIVYWMNQNVIKHFGDEEYYNRVNNLSSILEQDATKRKEFLENINDTNLFIEAPAFSKVNVRELIKNEPNVMEPVILKKELIDYMKDKLNIMKDLTITSDIVLKDTFVAPMYTIKLYKLSEKIINSRDLGSVKLITGQPTRGRAAGGGSRLGQMEVEALASSGCEKSLKELATVKNDCNHEKRQLIAELIKTGTYNLPDNLSATESRTKTVVNTILKFLKS